MALSSRLDINTLPLRFGLKPLNIFNIIINVSRIRETHRRVSCSINQFSINSLRFFSYPRKEPVFYFLTFQRFESFLEVQKSLRGLLNYQFFASLPWYSKVRFAKSSVREKADAQTVSYLLCLLRDNMKWFKFICNAYDLKILVGTHKLVLHRNQAAWTKRLR